MKKILILFFLVTGIMFHTYAQNMISGTIVDSENNSPLVGATVVVKGTTVGTIADFDGKFQIKAPALNTKLEVSFIGYKTIEVTYTGQQSLNISLASSVSAIDEVVVVGYGTQKKSHLTGSISKVSNEGLGEIPVARADEALIGKISGVTIQVTNSKAGNSPTIRVRGTGSITASSSPLVVMDGVAVSSDFLGSIDMNDVESIEVLKDAASAAIYGSRAANGVLMITTKQGKEGKAKFSFNAYYGSKFTADYKTMPTVPEWTQMIKDYYGGLTDEAKYINLLGTQTKWTDIMFDGGVIQNYSLSVTGGNEKTKYAISGGYLSDAGVLLTDDYKKMNLRINLDTKVNKVVEFGGNFNSTYSTQRDFPPNIIDALRQSPWLPTYIDENTIQYVNKTKYPLVQVGDYAKEAYFDGYILPGNTTGTTINTTTNENPLAKVMEKEIYYYTFNMFTNTYMKLNLAKGLSFKSSVASEYSNLQNEIWSGTKLTASAYSTYNTNAYTHLVNENIFNYEKDFGKHSFSAVAGLAWEKWSNYVSGETGTGYTFDYIHTINAAATISTASTTKTKETLQSVISRFNYAYNNKYLASFSARWDGSSRFGTNSKYGFFPAASLGWRVSEEDFLKGNKTISNLKYRLSYGVTGNNQGIGLYDAIARLSPVTAVVTGNALAAYNPANIANPDLRWEKSVDISTGIDLGLFDNRLTMVMDYYTRSSKDLLLNQEIPSVTGFSTATMNIGEVKNSGVELEITGRIIASKNMNWTVSGNVSHNKNELVSFAGASGLITAVDSKRPAEYIALEGHPISSYYGYVYLKDVPNEYLKKPLYPIGGASQDCYVKDLNGDGVITTADRTILGSPYPKWVWGFTNNFNYKNIDFGFTFQGSHGAKVRNMDPQYIQNQFANNMDYITTFPDASLVKEKFYTDKFVQDASFISLRSVNLGYTLPRNIAHKAGMSKARIYASGQNLIYLMAKGYTSFNPEGVTDATSPLRGGYQVGAAPIAKTITVGVNLEF